MGREMRIVFGIVVILILTVTIFIVIGNVSDEGRLSEINANVLKTFKCYAFCPYEKRNNRTFPIQECQWACDDKFGGISGGASCDEQERFGEEIVMVDFIGCFVLMENKEEFIGCLNSKVGGYSEVVDFSDFDVEVDYKNVDIEVLDLVCDGSSAHVSLKISGDSVKGVNFIVNYFGGSYTINDFENNFLEEGVHEFNIRSEIDIEEVMVGYFSIWDEQSRFEKFKCL